MWLNTPKAISLTRDRATVVALSAKKWREEPLTPEEREAYEAASRRLDEALDSSLE